MNFSLERFEFLCYSRQHEAAAQELVQLLGILDQQYGELAGRFEARPLEGVDFRDIDQHLMARMAGAISCLFADPAFNVSEFGFRLLMPYHRWISSVFAASPYRNADHVIRSLNIEQKDPEVFRIDPQNYFKFCLLYSPESEIPLDVESVWADNKAVAASLFLTLMSPRFLGTPAAHSKRELLLAWLPDRLTEIPSIDLLPLGILHDVYMHCSYADLPQRHAIKAAINVLIRRKFDSEGIHDLPAEQLARARSHRSTANGKPVMLVLMEWFTGQHSIYRTHSLTLEGARKRFHVIGMGIDSTVDEIGKAVFDEFIVLPRPDHLLSSVIAVRQIAERLQPAVFYMPSVGMFPITMLMANLRIAALQVAALGHPATTRSDCIDRISVEEDFVGDPNCFSEQLLLLPRDGQPYRPSTLSRTQYPRGERSAEVVRIAIAATIMKINPRFLMALRQIADRAVRPCEFHFLVGQAQGLVYPQVRGLIHRFLGNAVVHPHQAYERYMHCLNQCDFFLSPFPFGNTNGIVDAVTVGLAGVNLSGPEVFEHIDHGLFKRLGLPDWLTATSIDAYVEAACRLINERDMCADLTQQLLRERTVERLFRGDGSALGESCAALLDGVP